MEYYAPPAEPDFDQRMLVWEMMTPEERQYVEWFVDQYAAEITSDATYTVWDMISLMDFLAADPNTTVDGLKQFTYDVKELMENR